MPSKQGSLWSRDSSAQRISRLTGNNKKAKPYLINVKVLFALPIVLVLIVSSVVVSRLSQNAIASAEIPSTEEIQASSTLRQEQEYVAKTNDALTLPIPNQPSLSLPQWIQQYLAWHQSMRQKYPGKSLFDDPNAPKLLIRTCLGLCGGLNDRLGQLPWDLYLANQTKRVLLLHWHRPVKLEHFLQPNELDWTVPQSVPGFFPQQNERTVSRSDMKLVRDSYPDLFEGYAADRPEQDFWDVHLDAAIERANNGKYKDEKVLRHRILGHINEEELEKRLRSLGETDMLHWTLSFGNIFWMFFKPARDIEAQLVSILHKLGLVPNQYSAVHCRVRHPKANPKYVNAKSANEAYPADKSGLAWSGESRDFAIETATLALQCASTLITPRVDVNTAEPVYFFSDSNDLVQYMSHELTDEQYVNVNKATIESNPIDAKALQIVSTSGIHVIAREASKENVHIDRQKGRAPEEYYSTFIDFFLAVFARCLTYGIGYYAIFATKVSGTSCKLLYQEEFWGGLDNKRANTDKCVLPLPATG